MSHVGARILWPALGCPAVIAPRGNPPAGAPSGVQHRLCVLLLCERERLTPQDVAEHLRIVPWSQRTRRHIRAGEPGSFAAADLEVRSDVPAGTLTRRARDDHGVAVVFGGDRPGLGVVASLSSEVRRFYTAQGLRHLHEVRVAERACVALTGTDPYHVFWNAAQPGEGSGSDELSLLLSAHAVPRRQADLDEYRYEFNATHRPYSDRDRERRFTEILHPVFVRRDAAPLRLGHVTDTHVDTRHDVYARNLAGRRDVRFNNWNESFEQTYADAKATSDVLLLTGDLIDYGRGHVGLRAGEDAVPRLDADGAYHQDRNWFLFSYLLASGSRYRRPVYTSLGNHDWRLNPYPPFAPGAPSPKELVHNYSAFSADALREIVRVAHGPGHDASFMYATPRLRDVPGAIAGHYDVPGSPLQTNVDSVRWYLLAINPFLDYSVPFPGGQQLLMLDWAEDEEVIDADWLRRGTPRPADSLSSLQRWHVTEFLRTPGQAKVLGVHAPVLGPAFRWNDDALRAGEVTYPSGADIRMRRPNGEVVRVERHTLYAIAPRGEPVGVAAGYGSLVHHRDWLIDQIAAPASGVRVVLSGHIHRDGLFTTRPAAAGNGRLLRWVDPVAGGRAFASPLYVNTGSAGPRGSHVHANGESYVAPRFHVVTLTADGLIAAVQRRQLVAPPPTATPRRATPQIFLTNPMGLTDRSTP